MAIGKIAVRVIAGAGLVGLGYAGIGGQDDTTRNEVGQIVEGGEIGAFRIRLGDCFEFDIPSADEGFEIESVHGVPCREAHDGEVYHAFLLSGDQYPGDEVVGARADTGCHDAFEPFVGHDYATSTLDFWTMTPSEGSWEQLDDREVLCVVANYDGTPKSGSAKGAGV